MGRILIKNNYYEVVNYPFHVPNNYIPNLRVCLPMLNIITCNYVQHWHVTFHNAIVILAKIDTVLKTLLILILNEQYV